MKCVVAVLLSLFSIIFTIVFLPPTTFALSDESAMAQKKLYDEYIPFTPEKFLHYVFMNEVEIVELFLEGGISIDKVNSQGRSALHIAAGTGDGRVLRLLLARGANVNRGDRNDTTPLCIAVDDGHLENTKMLLHAKADINALCGVDLKTPLYYAASEGHGSLVKLLLGEGAAVDKQNRLLNTPLHGAVHNDNPAILQLLIEAGADVTARNRNGDTPLHMAVTRNNMNMVKLLLTAGAQLEARNTRGATPLWLAANYDAVEIAKILIHAGADPEAEASDGDTPIQIAEKARSMRVVEILRNALGK